MSIDLVHDNVEKNLIRVLSINLFFRWVSLVWTVQISIIFIKMMNVYLCCVVACRRLKSSNPVRKEWGGIWTEPSLNWRESWTRHTGFQVLSICIRLFYVWIHPLSYHIYNPHSNEHSWNSSALTYCNTKGIQYTFTMAATNLRSNLSTYQRAFQLWPVLRGLTQVKPSCPAWAGEGSERQGVRPEDRRQVSPSEEHFGWDQLLQRSRQTGPLVSSPSTLWWFHQLAYAGIPCDGLRHVWNISSEWTTQFIWQNNGWRFQCFNLYFKEHDWKVWVWKV